MVPLRVSTSTLCVAPADADRLQALPRNRDRPLDGREGDRPVLQLDAEVGPFGDAAPDVHRGDLGLVGREGVAVRRRIAALLDGDLAQRLLGRFLVLASGALGEGELRRLAARPR